MIELINIKKSYGENTVYDSFNLNIEENKILCILGESGSGKTTLLNILAGITPFEGEITGNIAPVSFVFQKDRLAKNLTVSENLKLVCPEADTLSALESIGLKEYANAYPKVLSAGMARRVAVLRAFLYPSALLLMDEPFVNLDIKLKYMLIQTVKDMQKKNPKTVVCVTHDIKEAVLLADRIAVLKKGAIIYDTDNINAQTENKLFDIMLNG